LPLLVKLTRTSCLLDIPWPCLRPGSSRLESDTSKKNVTPRPSKTLDRRCQRSTALSKESRHLSHKTGERVSARLQSLLLSQQLAHVGLKMVILYKDQMSMKAILVLYQTPMLSQRLEVTFIDKHDAQEDYIIIAPAPHPGTYYQQTLHPIFKVSQ